MLVCLREYKYLHIGARSLVVAGVVCAVLFVAASPAGEQQNLSYTGIENDQRIRLVVNPYEHIDWSRVTHHRANLHTHSTASDGFHPPHEVIDRYHQMGYTVLALTDHDVVTWPWSALSQMSASDLVYQRHEQGRAPGRVPAPFENRDAAALGMIPVAGNELSRNHHVVSLFSPFEAPKTHLNLVLMDLASTYPEALAIMAHPAMHWPGKFGPVANPRIALHNEFSELTNGEFAIEAWFRTNKQGRSVLLGSYTGSTNGIINLELHTDNRLRVYIHPTSKRRAVEIMAVPTVDTRQGYWHHLAVTRRGEHIYVYVDGVLIGRSEQPVDAFPIRSSYLYFGRDIRTGDLSFQGNLDNVRFWRRAFTSEEVVELANGDEPCRSDLLAEYLFEEKEQSAFFKDTAEHANGPFHMVKNEEMTAVYSRIVPELPKAHNPSTRSLKLMSSDLPASVPDLAVTYYEHYFNTHPVLIAMEVVNGTRPIAEFELDRQLWDRLLTRLMPYRPVWGMAADDMHSSNQLGKDWATLPLVDLTHEQVRLALKNGAYTFSSVRLATEQPAIRQATPVVTSIEHNALNGTLTLTAEIIETQVDPQTIAWISQGKVVQTGPVFSYADGVFSANYVRAEIQGPGGRTFTNAFGFSNSDITTQSDVLPREFVLHQNYPNPFNPITIISFELSEQAEIELGVYDLLGRKVRLLRREMLPAGAHYSVFHKEGLASGVYIYRLDVRPTRTDGVNTAWQTVHSRSMTILK